MHVQNLGKKAAAALDSRATQTPPASLPLAMGQGSCPLPQTPATVAEPSRTEQPGREAIVHIASCGHGYPEAESSGVR